MGMGLILLLGMMVPLWGEDVEDAQGEWEPMKQEAYRGDRRAMLREAIQNRVSSRVRMADEMNLSQEQKQEFFLLVVKYRQGFMAALEQAKEKKAQLKDLVLSSEHDEEAIRSVSGDLGEILGEISVLISEFGMDARGILSEEQVDIFMKFQESKDSAINHFLGCLRGAGSVQ